MVNGQKAKQIGRVVSVTQTKNGMVQCSVQLSHAGGIVNNVPIGKPHAGVMWKPEPGWSVVIDYMNDGNPFISDVLSVPSKEYQAPQLAEGSMTFRFDGSTAITVDKNDDGNYTVDLSANGASVTLDGDGAIEVKAADGQDVSIVSDSVTLGGEDGSKPVARKGDPVSVSDPVSGELTGEVTDGSSTTESK